MKRHSEVPQPPWSKKPMLALPPLLPLAASLPPPATAAAAHAAIPTAAASAPPPLSLPSPASRPTPPTRYDIWSEYFARIELLQNNFADEFLSAWRATRIGHGIWHDRLVHLPWAKYEQTARSRFIHGFNGCYYLELPSYLVTMGLSPKDVAGIDEESLMIEFEAEDKVKALGANEWWYTHIKSLAGQGLGGLDDDDVFVPAAMCGRRKRSYGRRR
jgi:hypothetical protein